MPAFEQSIERNNAPAPSYRASYNPLKREHSDAVLNASGAEKNQTLIQNYSGYMPPHMNLKKHDIRPTQAWMEPRPSRDTAPNGADKRPSPVIEAKPAKGSKHHAVSGPASGSGPSDAAAAPPPPPPPPVLTPYRRRRPEELELAM